MENGNIENETQGMTQAPIMSEMPMMPQAPMMPEPPKPPKAPKAPKTPSSRKKIKLIALISIISFVVIAGLVACFFLFMGRSKEKVVTKYEKAFNEKDKDSMLSLMFPKDQIKDAKKLFKKDDFDFVSWSKDLRSDYGKVSLKLIDAVDAKEYDEYLCDDIEDILFDELDIAYEEIAVANLEVDCKDDDVEELSKVIIYKSGKDWYILPGLMQLIKAERQKDDLKTAEKIYDFIYDCLYDSDVMSCMEMYYGVVISIDKDLEYLPQEFRDAFNNLKYDSLRNTEDGATGYAFMINDYGEVFIYISSEERVDEWAVFPNASSEYYTGEKQTPEDSNATDACSYVQLVSDKSPILGYWQAEDAGMYIGYNTSGGTEGFTIYYSFAETFEGILNHLDSFEFSGGNGYITVEDIKRECTYKFIVNNEKSITCEVSDGKSYEFEKNDINQSVRNNYVGEWIYSGIGLGMVGDEMKVEVCNKCGYIHDENYKDDFHSSPVVELYNGKALVYIIPKEGLFAELGSDGSGEIVWEGYTYEVDEEGYLICSAYVIGGGGLPFEYVKKGSDAAKIVEAVVAYQEFSEQFLEILGWTLIDIDDDGIPEAVLGCGDAYNAYVLSYKNGKLYSCPEGMLSRSEISIQKDTQCIMISSSPTGGLYGYSFYKFSENGFEEIGSAYVDELDVENIFYSVNGKEVSEKEYTDYIDSFGDFEHISFECSSIMDAYAKYRTNN